MGNNRPIARRRIWFMRKDELEAEEARLRIANHVSKCNAFSDEIYDYLMILTPDSADTIIEIIRNFLSQNIKIEDDNNT